MSALPPFAQKLTPKYPGDAVHRQRAIKMFWLNLWGLSCRPSLYTLFGENHRSTARSRLRRLQMMLVSGIFLSRFYKVFIYVNGLNLNLSINTTRSYLFTSGVFISKCLVLFRRNGCAVRKKQQLNSNQPGETDLNYKGITGEGTDVDVR